MTCLYLGQLYGWILQSNPPHTESQSHEETEAITSVRQARNTSTIAFDSEINVKHRFIFGEKAIKEVRED